MAKQSSLGGDIVWVIEVAWCAVRFKQQEEGDWRVTVRGRRAAAGLGKARKHIVLGASRSGAALPAPVGYLTPRRGATLPAHVGSLLSRSAPC